MDEVCKYIEREIKKEIKTNALHFDTTHLHDIVLSFCKSNFQDAICYFANEMLGRELHKENILKEMMYSEIIDRFPYVDKVVDNYINLICGFLKELNSNINTDRNLLESMGINTSSKIKFKFLGDIHCRGIVTQIIDENNKSVIFKPRSFENERFVNECINLFQLSLPLIKGIDKKKYSWHEFVETNVQITNDSMYKLGEFIFLLNVLSVTDMHYENVIFTKNGPMILDCETIMTKCNSIGNDADAATKKAHNILSSSLYSIGILPIGDSEKFSILNKSGFLKANEEEIVFVNNRFEIIKEVKYLRFDSYISNNIVKENIQVVIYGYDCAFKKAQRLYIDDFRELLDKNIEKLEIRKLYRNTFNYAKLIKYKNSLMGNSKGVNYEVILKADSNIPTNIIEKEEEMIRKNIVPSFIEHMSDTYIDKLRIQTINKLDSKLHQFNINLILFAFEDYYLCDFKSRHTHGLLHNELQKLPSLEDFDDIKKHIYAKIEKCSIQSSVDNSITWMDAAASYMGNLDLRILNTDFYGGSKGIIYACSLTTSDYTDKILVNSKFEEYLDTIFPIIYTEKTFENIIPTKPESIDIMSGLSGNLIRNIKRNYDNNVIEEQTIKLIETMKVIDHKIFKSGYIHGLSGIASAIILAAQHLKNTSFLKYGIHLFNEELCNIKESEGIIYILSNQNNNQAIDWCSGLGGILASFLSLITNQNEYLLSSNDYKIFMESNNLLIEQICLNLIIESYKYSNLSLCHGQSGSIVLLYDAMKKGILKKESVDELYKLTNNYTLILKADLINFGFNNSFDTNSLFLGNAGIIYTLNYIENYQRMKSIMYI